jgi:hypothetical protein
MAPSNDDTFLPTTSVTGGPAREASFIFSTPPATIPRLNLLTPTTRSQ